MPDSNGKTEEVATKHEPLKIERSLAGVFNAFCDTAELLGNEAMEVKTGAAVSKALDGAVKTYQTAINGFKLFEVATTAAVKSSMGRLLQIEDKGEKQ